MKDHTTKGLIIEEIQVTLWLQGFLWCIQLFNKIQIWLKQNNLFWTLKLNAIKKRNKQRICSFPPSHSKFMLSKCSSSHVTTIPLTKATALQRSTASTQPLKCKGNPASHRRQAGLTWFSHPNQAPSGNTSKAQIETGSFMPCCHKMTAAISIVYRKVTRKYECTSTS